MDNRIDDPNLDVNEDDILILRNAGPVGAPAMPESGYIPIPKKLARQGVRDMVRISDARMSGTAFGSIVLHICPEAADGGPIALVRTGDRVVSRDGADLECWSRRGTGAPSRGAGPDSADENCADTEALREHVQQETRGRLRLLTGGLHRPYALKSMWPSEMLTLSRPFPMRVRNGLTSP
jgi:dihydroxyacid dehydratase/phosphogluconate dehydratase